MLRNRWDYWIKIEAFVKSMARRMSQTSLLPRSFYQEALGDLHEWNEPELIGYPWECLPSTLNFCSSGKKNLVACWRHVGPSPWNPVVLLSVRGWAYIGKWIVLGGGASDFQVKVFLSFISAGFAWQSVFHPWHSHLEWSHKLLSDMAGSFLDEKSDLELSGVCIALVEVKDDETWNVTLQDGPITLPSHASILFEFTFIKALYNLYTTCMIITFETWSYTWLYQRTILRIFLSIWVGYSNQFYLVFNPSFDHTLVVFRQLLAAFFQVFAVKALEKWFRHILACRKGQWKVAWQLKILCSWNFIFWHLSAIPWTNKI